MALFTVLMCVNFASCSSDDEFENGLPVKNNAIYYTTTDGIIIRLKKDDVFGGASIVSNTYSTTKGYGTIEFSSEVTAIEYCAFIDCSTLKKITLPNSIITILSIFQLKKIDATLGKYAIMGKKVFVIFSHIILQMNITNN